MRKRASNRDADTKAAIDRCLAPEYFTHGIVDEKTDVFAFGVFLLELISGRKPVDGSHKSLIAWVSMHSQILNQFPVRGRPSCQTGNASIQVTMHVPVSSVQAKPYLSDGVVQGLVDPRLGDDYDGAQLRRLMFVASLCIRAAAAWRPTMTQVRTQQTTLYASLAVLSRLVVKPTEPSKLTVPFFFLLIIKRIDTGWVERTSETELSVSTKDSALHSFISHQN